MKPKQSRQRVRKLQVPVLPEEDAFIRTKAALCGLPIAAYLRRLGLQYEPKRRLDLQAMPDLIRVNADLGRLGGLLKMYLSNDERFQGMGRDRAQQKVQALLDDIQQNQDLLRQTVKKLKG